MSKYRKMFRSYRGRHFISRWVRRIAERPFFHRLVGFTILLGVFCFTILTPQTLAYVETVQTANVVPTRVVFEEVITRNTFQWPLKNYNISQNFSWHHWGFDLTASEGTPLYPIAKGKVIEVGSTLLGYGNYLVIDHQNGHQSLYAHLSKVEVKNGDEIDVDQIIGRVGHTGWATGNHLHLEIHAKGVPLDPLEVLPEK